MSTSTQMFGAGSPASVETAPPANPPSDKTSLTTIILSIIGAILAPASVVIAVMQYRLQMQRARNVEQDGDDVEMAPQLPVQGEQEAMVPEPA